MHESRSLAAPADVVYLYDGSFAGFLCCVHQSVYSRELPVAIWEAGQAQPTFYPQIEVETDIGKAEKVQQSIPAKICPAALELVREVFMSCLAEKELAMLRFLLLGYRKGAEVVRMLGAPEVALLMDAQKHLYGEAHLLKGFVRFADYGGALGASISPKNFVLPFIAEHFVMRYPEEDFIIFDKTHKAALVYQNRKHQILPMDSVEFPEFGQEELAFQALWKQFYKTVAIRERYNPKCRRTHMPKRYWENMTEMREFL